MDSDEHLDLAHHAVRRARYSVEVLEEIDTAMLATLEAIQHIAFAVVMVRTEAADE